MRIENALLLVALVGDICYPLLNWKLGLPQELRWISQAALMFLGAVGIYRSLSLRKFPVWLLGLAGWFSFSAVQALTNGQSIGATVWGLYTWLRYPLIGLYVLTRPTEFSQAKRGMYGLAILLVALNLIVQIFQLIAGEKLGDNLAGFWGAFGTSRLASFVCLALALAFGWWVVRGMSRSVWMLLGMGIASCILGEVKAFPLVVLLMGGLAVLLSAYKKRRLWKGLILIVVLIGGGFAYVRLYDMFIKTGGGVMSYVDPKKLLAYFSTNNQLPGPRLYLGRLTQLEYVWKLNSGDLVAFLFGHGVGALDTSTALGTAGISLSEGPLGVFGATTLAALLGDFGMLGLVTLFLFLAAVVLRLVAARGGPDQAALDLGLVIFICTLPLWMFYMQIWVTPVTMLFLWMGLGQSLRKPQASVEPEPSSRPWSSGRMRRPLGHLWGQS